jgi:hypothetical protein
MSATRVQDIPRRRRAVPADSRRNSEAFGVYAVCDDERIAVECGHVVGLAIGSNRKKVADEYGKSVDVLDKSIGGEKSNPLYRLVKLVLAMPFPEHVMAYLSAVVARHSIRGESTQWLVNEWLRLFEYESEVQGREDCVTAAYRRTRDMEAFNRAHRDEVAVQTKLAAIGDELRSRGVDPMENS